MAIGEGEYLLLQQRDKLYMLLGKAGKYHLVTVDRRFTEEKEEKLLQLYPCFDRTLQELEITVSALSVRGVAYEYPEAGDELILYVGKKKHRYVLSDDASQEQMENMFSGVARFSVPKKKHKPDQWRLAAQKKELVPVMKGIKLVLLVLSWVSVAGLVFHHPLWSIPGILISVSCAVLDLVYPQYFTLLDFGKGEKDKPAIGLAFPAAFPLLVQVLYISNRFNFLTMEIFAWSVAVGIAVGVIFGLKSREFSENTGNLIALVILIAFSAAGPIGMVNALTDGEAADVYPVTVEEKYESSGKSHNYFCSITLKNGEDFALEVSRDEYIAMSVGETIVIAYHEGGLGIEYISLVEP